METKENELVISQEEKKFLQHLALSSKRKKQLIFAGIAAVMVLICVIFAVSNANLKKTIHELNAQIKDLTEQPIVVNPVAPFIALDTIYEEIQGIGELATVEYLFTDAAIFTDSKQIGNWNIPFTQKSFTIKWDGIIKAGIQIEQIAIHIDQANALITIALPASQILSYEVDTESVEVLNEKNNIFNKITIEDKIELDIATEKAMIERAIQSGLLEDAQENAEKLITKLLLANDVIRKNYSIVFERSK